MAGALGRKGGGGGGPGMGRGQQQAHLWAGVGGGGKGQGGGEKKKARERERVLLWLAPRFISELEAPLSASRFMQLIVEAHHRLGTIFFTNF